MVASSGTKFGVPSRFGLWQTRGSGQSINRVGFMSHKSLLLSVDRWVARSLPGHALQDLYTRGMRRIAEHTPFQGQGFVRTLYGFDIATDRRDAIKWYLHYFSVWEPQISEAWARILPKGGTVIDIGGNIGYHALLAAKLVGPTGRVLTFEPSQRIFEQLESNIRLNGFKNVEPIRSAVSDRSGTAEFHMMPDNEQGLGSLIPQKGAIRTEVVNLITFEEIAAMVEMGRVDLVKIDVEGAEALLVAGMASYDFSPHCVIFIEVSPSETATELLAPLLEKGFHARRIENEYRTRFYQSPGRVRFSPLAPGSGSLQDVVLCRDPSRFDQIADRQ